ncbi:StAR-related lipid transfer protein 7, mitochondrial [Senna tora]|uniref:StAR-related lipid transfer protein 7, mitochondrial n=1 Tax=Senna tora TaxID=362788 RepID=A0A835CJ27_9FABA|nr:StAR-related lipid transfer protein 7, mitochondrial [Senna tora]
MPQPSTQPSTALKFFSFSFPPNPPHSHRPPSHNPIVSSRRLGWKLPSAIYSPLSIVLLLHFFSNRFGHWKLRLSKSSTPSFLFFTSRRPSPLSIIWKLIEECEHPLAPRQRKYLRVEFFRSGWRIRNVPGRNACEITLFHQEDAGLNMEVAKLAFSRGIWNYVCKMDNALRRSTVHRIALAASFGSSDSMVSYIEVPTWLDAIESSASPVHTTIQHGQVTNESHKRMILRRPSRKFLANSLLLLGGAICLSRGHSSLGAKVALAYMIKKLGKHRAKSNSGKQN